MEKRRNKVVLMLMLWITLILPKILFGLTPLTIEIDEISFDDTFIVEPNSTEYDSNKSEQFYYYIDGVRNAKVNIKINSNCNQSIYLIITAQVVSGEGIGDLCPQYTNGYTIDPSQNIELDFNGTLPNYVTKRSFTWRWLFTAIPCGNNAFCANTSTIETDHTAYFVLDPPLAPSSSPTVEILGYACQWANGQTTANGACNAILSNGFAQHYTWNGTCHLLSSDFVRLVTALGIEASLHRWSYNSESNSIGVMLNQKTIAFDPIGSVYGYGQLMWEFHQWAEAEGYQRDPSSASSYQGIWGDYEDYFFTEYLEKAYPSDQWVANQSGQSEGCEAPNNRIYIEYPDDSDILYPFQGPVR